MLKWNWALNSKSRIKWKWSHFVFNAWLFFLFLYPHPPVVHLFPLNCMYSFSIFCLLSILKFGSDDIYCNRHYDYYFIIIITIFFMRRWQPISWLIKIIYLERWLFIKCVYAVCRSKRSTHSTTVTDKRIIKSKQIFFRGKTAVVLRK